MFLTDTILCDCYVYDTELTFGFEQKDSISSLCVSAAADSSSF